MKKQMILGLLGIFLCSAAAPLAADNCQNWNQCCEWSMCDGRFNVGADWLYWKTEQDNMLVGTIVDSVTPYKEQGPDFFHGKNKRPNFKYDSGFRVWAGYELPCDCWDVGVSYTYLPASANIVSFVQPDAVSNEIMTEEEFFSTYFSDFGLLRNFDGLGANGKFNEYRAKWNSNLNYIDVDLARTVCLGECFKFRPHVGFRAAWQDQKLRAFGVQTVETENEYQPETSRLTSTLLKQKFRGYGIEGGIWGDWTIGCGFSVVGHVGGSVLYSKFSVTQEQAIATLIGRESDPELQFAVDLHDSYWTGTPTADYFLGVKYEDCFCDMVFSVHAGWEQHIFFDMNRLSNHGGNLSMQGLTIGADIGF